MVNSMTGFSALSGTYEGTHWAWDIRSVNGRSLDVRVRLPEGHEALEKYVKAETSAVCARGTVHINLRLKQTGHKLRSALNTANLEAALTAMQAVEICAQDKGLSLAPSSAADVLTIRGVLEVSDPQDEHETDLVEVLKEAFCKVLAEFIAARVTEGAALAKVLAGQIDQIEALCGSVTELLKVRAEKARETLQANLQKILQNTEGVEEARLAQELALIAVKSDVTEELDRLNAHIKAARGVIQAQGPIGRKFDFLAQEFNREANTLCSKSNYADLTAVGLELKTVIDQLREQVQNVE